jgi:hypothetical protein
VYVSHVFVQRRVETKELLALAAAEAVHGVSAHDEHAVGAAAAAAVAEPAAAAAAARRRTQRGDGARHRRLVELLFGVASE